MVKLSHRAKLHWAILIAGLLLVAALGPAASAQSEKGLVIKAPANVYAHIYRDFPADDGNEIIVEARLKAVEKAGSSWVTSLGLYWFPTAFITVGHQEDARWRTYGVGVRASELGQAIGEGGEWMNTRIRLTSDQMQFWMKPDGDDEWTLLKEVERPSAMSFAPFEIIIGKGFGSQAAPYLEEHLDNSYAEPGDVGVAHVADLVVTVDGEEVLRDTFESLDGWDIHVDPEYADQIDIGVLR